MRALLSLVVLLGTVGGQTAGTPPRPSQTVRVAAAADLQFALADVIAQLAGLQPDLRVEAVYGSSGNMHAQLRQRAPYDVYLSADVEYPRDLVSRGVGRPEDLFVYATGRLVIWVSTASPLGIERDGLRALAGARRLALANPRHAPYGRAAEAALRGAGLWDQVAPRLVLGDNVAQAAQFVQSGAADAALIARSLAVAPGLAGRGRAVEVPRDMHPVLTQGGLILPWAASRAAAERLREFLVGPRGQQILVAHGFEAPPR